MKKYVVNLTDLFDDNISLSNEDGEYSVDTDSNKEYQGKKTSFCSNIYIF